MKGLAILGSTGSVGTQTLDVVRQYPGAFRVVGLAARKSLDVLEEQARELKESLEKIESFETEIIVVSLGVDTFEKDPISFFKLKSGDFLSIGKLIAELELPTLFVMEGGYNINELGVNVVNVLQGFEG